MKSNSRMNVAVHWWEAVNHARAHMRTIKLGIKHGARTEVVRGLRELATCYETWMACQKRWARKQMSKEQQQIADVYIALEINIGDMFRLIAQLDEGHITLKQFGSKFPHIEELVKVASNMPLFGKAE